MKGVAATPFREQSIHFRGLARRHAWTFVYLPAFGVVAGILAWDVAPPTPYDLLSGLALWAISMLGITVGYHRLCTHRAFRCGPGVTVVLLAAGATAANYPVINWSAVHRRHHQHSDAEGDPHSPNLHGEGWRRRLRGILHTQWGWIHGYSMPNPWVVVPDLLANRAVMWANRHYTMLALTGLFLPAMLSPLFSPGWRGFLSAVIWAGFFRLLLVQQLIFTVNSLGHLWGTRPHPTADQSRNNALVAAVTMGEGWHNNHHRYPSSAFIGLRWWQLDPGAWLITVLRWAGLVWDVVDARKGAFSRTSHESIQSGG